MRALLVLLSLLAAGAAAAQPASLVADRVRIESDSTLIAEGNVEVFYEDARLTASRVTFDSETDELSIEGPVRVTEGDGQTVLVGDTADLEADLRDGILTGARLVLSQQLQIAADELSTIDGRYRRLTNAVASSCRICASGQTPLWEIRAKRVLHDTEERQIYFTRAQFRVAGIPVAYIPRLRLPDPTVERARGFLAPIIQGSGDIGNGVAVPYFIPLGQSADITIAPFLTPNSRTVELRYRQAFRRGYIDIGGAISRDDLLPGQTRGYVLGSGLFLLPKDFVFRFRIHQASDDDYLDSYGYYTGARLENRATVDRIRTNELIHAAIYNYDILRPGDLEPADQNLINIGEAQYIRVMPTRFGRFDLQADADGYYRDSDQDVLGRDVGRIGAALTWTRGTVLPYGVALDGTAQLRLDAFSVRRDPSYAPHFTQATPAAAVALRWPLVRTGDGFAETLEPVAQLVWSDVSGDEAPNEDSRVVDFDEGNLFSLDRYPGRDLSETGARLNLGISYTRLESDWQLNGYIGRIYRFDDEYQFSEPTGLAGQWSDWLVSAQLGLGDAFLVTNRAVFDNSFDVARNELRTRARGRVGGVRHKLSLARRRHRGEPRR